MCVRHWKMLPKEILNMVWAEYQPGQERLDGTATPTDKYLEVTRYAIDWLEEYEEANA
jgi:hypothetical protein